MNPSCEQQSINPFDFIAELIRQLSLNERLFGDSNQRNALTGAQECDSEVDELLKPYLEGKDPIEIISRGLPRELLEAVKNWEHSKDFQYIFTLVLKLDRLMPWDDIIKSSRFRTSKKSGFHALNDNADKTGLLIIPKVPSVNDTYTPSETSEINMSRRQKRWLDEWSYGINQDLKNIYYTSSENLKVAGVIHSVRHWIADNILLSNKEILRVGISPLVRDAELDISFYEGDIGCGNQKLFSVAGIKNEDRVLKRFKAAYLRACRDGVDIFICPEMLGTERLTGFGSDYSQMIDSFAEEAENEGFSAPSLIICPTFWHNNSNSLCVLNNKSEKICTQEKQFPFIHKENIALEDLRGQDRSIQIIHIPGLGRLAFPICIDLLHEDYIKLLVSELHCTFLICPSFSAGETLFELSAAASKPHGCYTVWCNSCTARFMLKNKAPGFTGCVSCPIPGGENTCYLKPECGWKCGGDSDACLFEIDIGLYEENEGVISCSHIYPGC